MSTTLSNRTLGGQIIKSKIKLFSQVHTDTVIFGLLCGLIIFVLSCFFVYPRLGPEIQRMVYNKAWWENINLKVFKGVNPVMNYPDLDGSKVEMTRSEYVQKILFPNKYEKDFVADFRFAYSAWLYFTSFFSVAGTIAGWWFWGAESTKHAKKMMEEKYIRGAQLISEKEYRERTKDMGVIPVGFVGGNEKKPIVLPQDVETEHLLILKRPGQGGTTLINLMLEKVIERGYRCLIFDYKGDYTQRFFRPGRDIILNPMDERSPLYSFFEQDIDLMHEINMLGSIMLPEGYSQNQKYFEETPRDILIDLLEILYKTGKRTNREIYKYCTQDLDNMANFLRNNGAADSAGHLERGTDKSNIAALNLRSTTASRVRFLKNSRAIDVDGSDFSLKRWAQSGEGNIFLAANPAIIDSLKTLYCIYLDLLFNYLLSLTDDLNRRIFVFLDEFGNLPRLTKINEILAVGRSKGVSVTMSLQSIDQLRQQFGDKGADVVNSLFGSYAVFCVEGNTKEFCSKLIGKTTVTEPQSSVSVASVDMGDRYNITLRENEKWLVDPATISQIEKFHYYLRIAGMKEWTFTRTIDPKVKSFPAVNQIFLPRPDPLHEDIEETTLEKEKVNESVERNNEKQQNGIEF